MNKILAIAFSLSKDWKYRVKKEAIDAAGSFQRLVEISQEKFKLLDLKAAENQFKKIENQNGWIWVYGDKNYPDILSKIPDPPLLIYGMGQSKIDEENTLAFVGTRNPSSYGKRVAQQLARNLVREGIVLISGLARGIDSVAHQVSIDSRAPTVAVVAHGLDMIYPPENRKMVQDLISCGGSIISEFPFGITPLRGYFSLRNRVISGLSKGVLVIEAGENSGTKHTVNHALEQSREVFAVPGQIDSEYSNYTNELIFTGATMVRSCEDVLTFYPNRKVKNLENVNNSFNSENNFTQLQIQIMKFFNKDIPKSIEHFLAESNVEPKLVVQSLTELELHRKVRKTPDSMYILINEGPVE